MNYQQGLAPQLSPAQQQASQFGPQPIPQPFSGLQSEPPPVPQEQQQIKFYKSGLFGFSSAPGRMERDSHRMQSNGWRLQFAAYLGMNLFLRRMIVATWVR